MPRQKMKPLCDEHCNVFISHARPAHQRAEVCSVSCAGGGFVKTGLLLQ